MFGSINTLTEPWHQLNILRLHRQFLTWNHWTETEPWCVFGSYSETGTAHSTEDTHLHWTEKYTVLQEGDKSFLTHFQTCKHTLSCTWSHSYMHTGLGNEIGLQNQQISIHVLSFQPQKPFLDQSKQTKKPVNFFPFTQTVCRSNIIKKQCWKAIRPTSCICIGDMFTQA